MKSKRSLLIIIVSLFILSTAATFAYDSPTHSISEIIINTALNMGGNALLNVDWENTDTTGLNADTLDGKDWDDLNLGGGSSPTGSVTAWLKSYPNTPILPDDWVECNGQVLNDIESVYDGQTIPDLNGNTDANKLFLRGAETSGGTGGSTNHKHGGHMTTLGRLYNTNYGTMTVSGTSDDCVQGCGGGSATSKTVYKTSPADVVVVPPYYEVVWIMKVK